MSSLTIQDYPSVNFNERSDGGCIDFLILHYTAAPLDRSLDLLTTKVGGVSSHYLVNDNNPSTIYRLVPDNKRAWHAGKAKWEDRRDINSHSIGIEIVNLGYSYGCIGHEPKKASYDWLPKFVFPVLHTLWTYNYLSQRMFGEKGIWGNRTWHFFPDHQIEAVTKLALSIAEKYDIPAKNVLGHADVAPSRKVDPGPLFPWEELAKNRLGIWPQESPDLLFSKKPKDCSVCWMQESLAKYGYDTPHTGVLDPETEKVISVFRMHYQQDDFTGPFNTRTQEILDSLLCQTERAKRGISNRFHEVKR